MGCSGSKKAAVAGAAPADKVQQPLEGDFKVTLERTSDDQTLGLSLTVLDAEAGVMAIENVKEEGLVPEFIKNNPNAADQHVKQGDRIIAVNGVSKDSDKMKEEFKQKTIVLTLQRQEQNAAAPTPATEGAPAQAEPAAEPATTEDTAAVATADGTAEQAPAAEALAAEAPTAEAAAAPAEAPAAEAPAAEAPAAEPVEKTTEGSAAIAPETAAETAAVAALAAAADAEAAAAAAAGAAAAAAADAEAAAAPAEVPAPKIEDASAAATLPAEDGDLHSIDIPELQADAEGENDKRLCSMSVC